VDSFQERRRSYPTRLPAAREDSVELSGVFPIREKPSRDFTIAWFPKAGYPVD
jgi:hypothetical protein